MKGRLLGWLKHYRENQEMKDLCVPVLLLTNQCGHLDYTESGSQFPHL